MATPRQRRPETERQEPIITPQQLIDQITQFARQLQQQLPQQRFTPEQMEELRRVIESMRQAVPPAQATAPTPRPTPTTVVVPAPRRVQQFVYDVAVSGTTYRLTLNDRLPTDSHGNLDVAAARRRLHDALLNNEPAPLGGRMGATVQMQGDTQAARDFNSKPQNFQMDTFHDRYLGQTYHNGEYTETNTVTIAQVQTQRPRGG